MFAMIVGTCRVVMGNSNNGAFTGAAFTLIPRKMLPGRT